MWALSAEWMPLKYTKLWEHAVCVCVGVVISSIPMRWLEDAMATRMARISMYGKIQFVLGLFLRILLGQPSDELFVGSS